MNLLMNRSYVFALCLLLPCLASSAGPDGRPGSRLDVPLQDFQGRERNASEFIGKGKWTVVALWAHDCQICNQEIHHMVFFHDAHHQKDAIVLGVSIDAPADRNKARQFIDRHSLNFTNLLGDSKAIARFGAGRLVGTPTFYIYSPEGALVTKRLGAMTREQVEGVINKKSQG